MKIYPAIDLIGGQCVRLIKGRFDQKTIYHHSPLDQAKAFADEGASYLHVIDLDGAKKGKIQQMDLILKMVRQSGVSVQVGGGIRSGSDIRRLIEGGVDRVILGSMAVKDPQATRKLFSDFGGEPITLALDFNAGQDGIPRVASHGWQSEGQESLWDIVESYRDVNLGQILCTDISRDGTLGHPNFEFYKQWIQRFPEIEIQASGGVSSLEDLKALKKSGIPAVIVGKALYEQKFSLQEALQC